MRKADSLFVWESTDGSKKSLLLVEDDSKSHSDIDRKFLEVCVYSEKEGEWKSEERLDYVEELQDYGIPEELID